MNEVPNGIWTPVEGDPLCVATVYVDCCEELTQRGVVLSLVLNWTALSCFASLIAVAGFTIGLKAVNKVDGILVGIWSWWYERLPGHDKERLSSSRAGEETEVVEAGWRSAFVVVVVEEKGASLQRVRGRGNQLCLGI